MRILKRFNSLSVFMAAICFLCIKVLVYVIQSGEITARSKTFSWDANPVMFIFCISVMVAGIVGMIHFIFFAERDDLKVEDEPDSKSDS